MLMVLVRYEIRERDRFVGCIRSYGGNICQIRGIGGKVVGFILHPVSYGRISPRVCGLRYFRSDRLLSGLRRSEYVVEAVVSAEYEEMVDFLGGNVRVVLSLRFHGMADPCSCEADGRALRPVRRLGLATYL